MKRQQHSLSKNAYDPSPTKDNPHVSASQEAFNPLIKPRVTMGLSSDSHYRAVAEMAYKFWEQRGDTQGDSTTDWLKAEAALKPNA